MRTIWGRTGISLHKFQELGKSWKKVYFASGEFYVDHFKCSGSYPVKWLSYDLVSVFEDKSNFHEVIWKQNKHKALQILQTQADAFVAYLSTMINFKS